MNTVVIYIKLLYIINQKWFQTITKIYNHIINSQRPADFKELDPQVTSFKKSAKLFRKKISPLTTSTIPKTPSTLSSYTTSQRRYSNQGVEKTYHKLQSKASSCEPRWLTRCCIPVSTSGIPWYALNKPNLSIFPSANIKQNYLLKKRGLMATPLLECWWPIGISLF